MHIENVNAAADNNGKNRDVNGIFSKFKWCGMVTTKLSSPT